MSGGSFDYLYLRESLDEELLQRMAEALEANGYEDVAAATRLLIPIEQEDPLRDVWRSMEWVVSGDWGPEKLEASVREWRDRKPVIAVRYRNYRGEVARRHVLPLGVRFGTSEHHLGGDQWLLEVWDHEKKATRTYTLGDCDFLSERMCLPGP